MIDPFDIPIRESADVQVPGVDGAFRISRETDATWLLSRVLAKRSPIVARIRRTADGWHPDSMHDGVDRDDELLWERAVQAAAHFPVQMHPARKVALTCLVLMLPVFVATLIYGFVGSDYDAGLLVLSSGLVINVLLLAVAGVSLTVGRLTRHWDPVAAKWSRRREGRRKEANLGDEG